MSDEHESNLAEFLLQLSNHRFTLFFLKKASTIVANQQPIRGKSHGLKETVRVPSSTNLQFLVPQQGNPFLESKTKDIPCVAACIRVS